MLLLLALCAGIVLWQYFRRETGRARLTVTCCAAAIIIGLPLLPWSFGFDVQMMARRPRIDLRSARIVPGLTPPARQMLTGEAPQDPIMIALPVKITGFPRDATLVPDGVRVSLSSGRRELWHSGWQQSWFGRNVEAYQSQVFLMDSGVYRALQNAIVTVKLSLALTLLEDERPSRVPAHQRAFTIFGNLCENQPRQNNPPFIRCLAAFQAPPPTMLGLEAAGASQTLTRAGTWSYAPYEALLDLSPVHQEYLPVSAPLDSCEETRRLWESPQAQLVFTPQRPVAHFRRELQFDGVRLADYALPPSRAVLYNAQQWPCGR
jgi:hypothetical protein